MEYTIPFWEIMRAAYAGLDPNLQRRRRFFKVEPRHVVALAQLDVAMKGIGPTWAAFARVFGT